MNARGWGACAAAVCLAAICTLLAPTVGAEHVVGAQHPLAAEHAPLTEQLYLREKRAIGRKLGAFSLFVQLITQTTNETISAYRQIRQLLADSVGPPPSTTNETSNATDVTAISSADAANATSGATVSTTAAPYRASSAELMTIFRRNILGLRNLFKKELKAALVDSGKNIVTAGKELLRPVSTTAKPG